MEERSGEEVGNSGQLFGDTIDSDEHSPPLPRRHKRAQVSEIRRPLSRGAEENGDDPGA